MNNPTATTSGRRGNTGKILISLVALAVAGLVAAAGSAFTGGGLSTSGQAPGSQFVGGSLSQTNTGAVLESTKYTVANNVVRGIDLTFDRAAAGKDLVVTLGGVTYTCSAGITIVGEAPIDPAPDTRTTSAAACTSEAGAANTATALAVTVTEPAE
jgi:hypothetical protein